MISYRIEAADPKAHLFHVRLRIESPADDQRVSLPVWIPGSYLVREFGRHLSGLQARQGRRPVDLQQLDKTTWQARCSGTAALELRYSVYAFDTSVRTAFLDDRRGFFNGTGVFLRVEGREAEPHQVEIAGLPRGWQVATAMSASQVDPSGAGLYAAADYDELVDHPVELGTFWRGSFEVSGVPHEFVVAGAWEGFDGERLLADTRAICEAEIALWHGTGRRARPPYARYVFLLNCVDDGYGGLEHRASTALIAGRRDLPRQGVAEPGDGYVTLLGLISHEFFHTWNVKRLKPAELATIDYTRENHTELLWFFEGFTNYYDDLLLLRAGRIDAMRYLKLVSKAVSGVLGTPGRFVQSVAQSSFDAWVKYYRPDENSVNSTISYYTKGAMVAMAFDLTLRGEGRGTLDDVMRELWRRSGGGAITEADIAAALEQVGGRSFAAELQAWVHGTGDLPLATLLERVGVQAKAEPGTLAQRWGLRLSESALTGVQVKAVLRGSAAEAAGLAPGDELIAAQGWRLRRLEDLSQWTRNGERVPLLVARDQRIVELSLDGARAPRDAGGLSLSLAESPTPAVRALRKAWLNA